MKICPEVADFVAVYETGRPQVVWTTLVTDLETPVSAFLKLAHGQANSFLLESVEGGAIRGRYSFIGLRPDVVWRCSGNQAEINRSACTDVTAFMKDTRPILESLRALMAESHIELPRSLPPMAAGLFGYMGYDMVRLIETLPDTNPDTLDIPGGLFLRPTIMAIFDNIEDKITVVTPVWPKHMAASAAYAHACERLGDVLSHFRRVLLPIQHDRSATAESSPTVPVANMTREMFHSIVEKAKGYIFSGDIFQVVISQRLRIPFNLPPFALYRALRRLNPSPFLFFLNFCGYALVGSSPEILVRVRDGVVTIRPIAGTRPRGETTAADVALAVELLADPKERAEHLMLLDLGRNDVGRVAQVGSVRVTEKMVIERYSHVMHIVSNVEGLLVPEEDAMGALMAGFPAGTVSGAPKVRAMEIIEELEPERRSFYAGAIGYLSANGNMDTCITLRTALLKDGMMIIQAGGGVVADSDPESEYQESLNKARALLRAAEEAGHFASH